MEEKEVILKLYQNIDMGIVGIESIEDKIESRALLSTVMKQKEEYLSYKEKMLAFCKDYNVQDKDLGALAKMSSDMMSNMKLMMDKSDSHIAKMMMEGTNKGLIQLEELQNHYQGSDQKLIKMMEETLKMEQQNNEDLKVYL